MEYKYKDRTAVIYVEGDVDHHSLRGLNDFVTQVIESCLPRTLVFDMYNVSFMDSSGLALIIGGYRKITELEGSIIVRNAPKQAMRVFKAAGIDRFVIFENVERAV